jgi:hypothetical protein
LGSIHCASIPRFRIPDFPRGALLATVLFSVAWLAAFPDVPYFYVWGLITAAGIVTWVLGSAWIGPDAIGPPRNPPSSNNQSQRPSSDFVALIDAITAQGEASRQEEQNEDRSKSFREWLTIILLVGTVVLLRSQVIEMQKVYDPIKGQADAAGKQADAASTQAIVAKAQADAAIESARAVRENTIAAERAWVGPNSGALDAVPVAGNPVTFNIAYQNTGRQPARSFQSNADAFVVTLDEDLNGVTAAKLAKNMTDCLNKKPVVGAQVVYPSTGFASNQLSVTLDKGLIDDKVVSGDKILAVSGCFVYETFDSPHHSTFCFFYRSGMTKAQNLSFCPTGAYAD